MSAEQAEEWGIVPIAGTCFGAGETEGSTASTYIGADRPDLVWSSTDPVDPVPASGRARCQLLTGLHASPDSQKTPR
jgi:hypothetical protein